MEVVFDRPHALSDVTLSYCPGCTHGIIHRLIAEVVDELAIEGKTIGIAPVGCSVLAYNFFEFDMQEAAHGRAPAVATGIKRVHPDNVVFTYQEMCIRDRVAAFTKEIGFKIYGLDYSPVKGPEGNIEYLLYIGKSGEERAIDISAVVEMSHILDQKS